MPQFIYSARTSSGSLITREAVASSAEDLSARLRAEGLFVVDLRAASSGMRTWRKSVGQGDIAAFVDEFGSLLRAGLPVSESLSIAAERPDSRTLENILKRVHVDVQEGVGLSEAFAKHGDVFDRFFVTLVRIGEQSGNLLAGLQQYGEHLGHRIAMRRRLSQALAYPSFLLLALLVILAVLFLFVLPRFTEMYADFGADLPRPTLALVWVVDHIIVLAPVGITALALVVTAWRRAGRSEPGRILRDRFIGGVPWVGGIRAMHDQVSLARTLASLLAGGVPLSESLGVVRGSVSDSRLREKLSEVADDVSRGESLASALRSYQVLPEAALRMVAVGEATGGLAEMLSQIARHQDDKLRDRLARSMALVEPLLMLVMGVLVGVVIIVMYLPVFHLADVIR